MSFVKVVREREKEREGGREVEMMGMDMYEMLGDRLYYSAEMTICHPLE